MLSILLASPALLPTPVRPSLKAHLQRRVLPCVAVGQYMDEGCLVPDDQNELKVMEEQNSAYELALAWTPVVVPACAALTYGNVMEVYHFTVQTLSANTWSSADGGVSQTAALVTLVNGIVVPSCSVALGTLIALTISSLRLRQIQLRTLVSDTHLM